MSPNSKSSEALAAARVVLVARDTGGLGTAVSLAFLRDGANGIVTCRKQAELATLKNLAGAAISGKVGRRIPQFEMGILGVRSNLRHQ